jgi:transposase
VEAARDLTGSAGSGTTAQVRFVVRPLAAEGCVSGRVPTDGVLTVHVLALVGIITYSREGRRRVAAELIGDPERVDRRQKAADKALQQLVEATGSTLMSLPGMGPQGAARLLVEVRDVTRFPTAAHFASWTGTAPIDASKASGRARRPGWEVRRRWAGFNSPRGWRRGVRGARQRRRAHRRHW